MDKKIAGVIIAIGAAAPASAANAAAPSVEVNEVMNARSFAELLQPIQNASEV
jgi:hypothetical protein